MKLLVLLGVVAVGVIGFIWWNGSPEAPTLPEKEMPPVATSQANMAPVTLPAPEAPSKPIGQYTAADVAKHTDRSSCWTIVRGQVFDVTGAIDKHPGGADKILGMCGKDATSQFVGKHGGMEKQEAMLTSMGIGTLVTMP